ncbi:MAG: hypothetical protein IJI36_15915 [Kiritimatiellae bacterium]|nr:hypothetical protein [Kiritimatiellia bacterium]
MSSSEEWNWDWQDRRREIYLERVADTTRSFLDRYQQLISDMSFEGIDGYVRDDFEQAQSMIAEAYADLDDDPEHARELSRSIGPIVNGLPSYARSLKRQEETRRRNEEMARHAAEERARVIKEREKAELVSRLHMIAGEIISDPVANDLAYDRLQTIAAEISQAASDPDTDAKSLETTFRKRCQKLKDLVSEEAEVWRVEHRRIATMDAVKTEVDQQIKAVEEARKNKGGVAVSVLQGLTERLTSLKNQLTNGTVSIESADRELDAVQNAADEVHCSEELRRSTLRAINLQMQALGFVSRTPVLQDKWVRMVFSRPDGAQAIFLVDSAGAMKFTFDGYRGKACKKDRDAVMEKMRSAYGVKFSDQRVIWENPDEIGKDAVDAKRPDSFNGGF